MKHAVFSFSRTSQSLLASYGCYLLNYLTSIIITYILMCVEIDVNTIINTIIVPHKPTNSNLFCSQAVRRRSSSTLILLTMSMQGK